MIPRFFDASALVKRFVREPESEEVEALYLGSPRIISVHSFTEVGSTFGRMFKNADLTADQYRDVLDGFERSWNELAVIQYDVLVMMHGRALFPLYGLRAGDVVQLASAVVARHLMETTLEFVTYDRRLWQAARDHGFTPLPHNLLTK